VIILNYKPLGHDIIKNNVLAAKFLSGFIFWYLYKQLTVNK